MEDHIVSAHLHPPNYEDDRNIVDIARCLLSSCPRFQVEEEILLTAAPKSTGDPGSKAIASSQCAVASVHRKWYHKFALNTWLFLMTPIPTNLHWCGLELESNMKQQRDGFTRVFFRDIHLLREKRKR